MAIGQPSSSPIILTADGLREQCARIASTPNVIRLVLTVCRGVRDIQVDANANTIRVLPLRGARHGPDSAELIQHLDELGLGLTFVVAPPDTDAKRKPTTSVTPLAVAAPKGKTAPNGAGKTAVSDGGTGTGSVTGAAASNGRRRAGVKAGAGAEVGSGRGARAGAGGRVGVGTGAASLPPPPARRPNGSSDVGGGGDLPGAGVAVPAQPEAVVTAAEEAGARRGGGGLGPPVILAVKGMKCQKSCGGRVGKSLSGVPGVSRAEASFAGKRALVWVGGDGSGGGGGALMESLVAAVEAGGFSAAVMPDVVLEVEGMMCQRNCGSTVRGALASVPGVSRTEVSFADKRARVWGGVAGGRGGGGGGFPAEAELVEAVEAVGFGAAVTPAVVLEVEGMMCQKNCGTTVRKALEGVAGVARVEVSFPQKRAKVWADASGLLLASVSFGGEGSESESPLVVAVESVGFEASVAPTAVLDVEGMMCQKNCGTTVAGALESVPGVSRARVSFPEKRAKVWACSPGGVSVSTLVEAVISVGFDANPAASTPTLAPASADTLASTLHPRHNGTSAIDAARRTERASSSKTAGSSDVRVLSAAVAARVGVAGGKDGGRRGEARGRGGEGVASWRPRRGWRRRQRRCVGRRWRREEVVCGGV